MKGYYGNMYNDNFFTPQGWECPKCKRVYSPSTPQCLYCGNQKIGYGSSSECKSEYKPEDLLKNIDPRKMEEINNIYKIFKIHI